MVNWLGWGSEMVESVKVLRYEQEIMHIIVTVVRQHGGTIEDIDATYFLIHFPGGTIKHEHYPRAHATHFEIVFPDGFTLYETVTRDNVNSVQFPLSVFPEEIREKYQWV
jgi:hypothetical protein